MFQTFSIELAPQLGVLASKAAELLTQRLTERCGAQARSTPDAAFRVLLDVESGIGREGFRIEDAANGVRIAGNDERGLLYGVGKFLRGVRYDESGFVPGSWRGVSVPEMEVRGMYFATHFHNFYHEAPLEEIERYVEDLALWGCNALSVWFDMHHYTGINDPEAQAMIERLHAILKAANTVGMGAGLTTLANEAYANSPQELRAVPAKWHYHVELCPNKPGAMELMLQWRREMLDAFRDVEIEYVWIWPYDQGGCMCEACAPWGANGFLKMGEAEAEVVRDVFPRAKTVVSTWCFDYQVPGEYEGMWQTFATRPNWVDYLMIDAHGEFPQYPREHGAPAGLPVLNFTEISMQGMSPWGGFGANPLPHTIQKSWSASHHMLAGGFPYSEGIHEDINKAVVLQFYWDSARPAMETVREYAATEYSPDVAGDVARAIEMMEATQRHGLHGRLAEQLWQKGQREGIDAGKDAVLYALPKVTEPERCLALLQSAKEKLTDCVRQSWRWRILWLRAALDTELHRSGGRATEQSDAYFDELTKIYWAATAEAAVVPPGRRALQRVFAG